MALEHPYDPGRAIGTVALGAGRPVRLGRQPAGLGRRDLHHVLDGTTGVPVRTVVATWAMAGTAMAADALATALFFVDGARLQREFDFAWLTVYSDGHAEFSADFEGTLFS